MDIRQMRINCPLCGTSTIIQREISSDYESAEVWKTQKCNSCEQMMTLHYRPMKKYEFSHVTGQKKEEK